MDSVPREYFLRQKIMITDQRSTKSSIGIIEWSYRNVEVNRTGV